MGVPVTATLENGKWTAVREDGAEPSAEEAKELKKIARDISGELVRKMYGTEPRKPGDKWSVDAADTIFADDDETKDAKGKVELTFDKVEEYHGMKCAFLSCTIEITGRPGDADKDSEAKIKLSGKVAIIRALDLQTDIDAEMKATMEVETKLPTGGSMKMSGPMTLKSESKLTK